MNDDNLTERQERLMVWRDYFEMLQEGLIWNNGDNKDKWSQEQVEAATWIKVMITEIESDVMHLQCGQEERCRFSGVTDLAELDGNWDAREQ